MNIRGNGPRTALSGLAAPSRREVVRLVWRISCFLEVSIECRSSLANTVQYGSLPALPEPRPPPVEKGRCVARLQPTGGAIIVIKLQTICREEQQ